MEELSNWTIEVTLKNDVIDVPAVRHEVQERIVKFCFKVELNVSNIKSIILRYRTQHKIAHLLSPSLVPGINCNFMYENGMVILSFNKENMKFVLDML